MARLARAFPGQYKRWKVKAAVIVANRELSFGVTEGAALAPTGEVSAGSGDA